MRENIDYKMCEKVKIRRAVKILKW